MLSERRLLWLPELDIGFLDHEPPPDLYGDAYWQHYRELDKTEMGRALTEARLHFVLDFYPTLQDCIDVGIGGGRFVLAAGCSGWDVNPNAIRWLYENRALRDPRVASFGAATMWDVLEHMRDPSLLLDNVREWVFLATPIYQHADDAMHSKHYKPGEHLWYFTENGLCSFMALHGFGLKGASRMECDLGREAIGSYAFRRVR